VPSRRFWLRIPSYAGGTQPRVAYAVDSTKVDAEVATFSGRVLKSWKACLGEIIVNPYPRFGFFVDRLIPILDFPMKTWIYEISQETSISEQVVFVFTGDFFPEYAPVYLIDEDAKKVIMLFLRENDRA
jgi:hypothetical protein